MKTKLALLTLTISDSLTRNPRYGDPNNNYGFVLDMESTPKVQSFMQIPAPLQTANANSFEDYFDKVAKFWGEVWINPKRWGNSSLKVVKEDRRLEFYLDTEFFRNVQKKDPILSNWFVNSFTNSNESALILTLTQPEKESECLTDYSDFTGNGGSDNDNDGVILATGLQDNVFVIDGQGGGVLSEGTVEKNVFAGVGYL